ncbi:Retrotransposon gag protein [Corchorus capsularis]|uniref:Retrotransposon gag protein n=1 Tax=Corchorus capsularis TaxID=210143 RepID=A0A1R3GJ60_COCAP|nr:Retrotransposon gag protein [Corchorus capsularis]
MAPITDLTATIQSGYTSQSPHAPMEKVLARSEENALHQPVISLDFLARKKIAASTSPKTVVLPKLSMIGGKVLNSHSDNHFEMSFYPRSTYQWWTPLPSEIASVMTTSATTLEEKLTAREKDIADLIKAIEEKDAEIARLKSQIERQQPNDKSKDDQIHPPENESDDLIVIEENNIQGVKDPIVIATSSASVGVLSVQQLQEMITNTIKAQYGTSSKAYHAYVKPYTRRIDELKMPENYQPPKFQQFDGKGNPRQHVAHFIETCNNAGTYGDLLVKQFVRSLKGNAFDWYTDLDSESIDSWDQLEREFLNRFFSTRRTISMTELTNTRQRKDEVVIDYINSWRALTLDCKDKLSETSSVEMCINAMHFGLLYILQGIKPRTFKELATRAHDMELSIANSGNKYPFVSDLRRGKKDANEAKTSKSSTEESKFISAKNIGRKKEDSRKQDGQRVSLREKEAEKYPFPDSDVPEMLEQLMKNKLIELPYHPTEKCINLKELIMKLADEKKIEFGADDTVKVDYTTFTSSLDFAASMKSTCNDLQLGAKCQLIQFGLLEPVLVQFSKENSVCCLVTEGDSDIINEAWTFMKPKNSQRRRHQPKISIMQRRYQGKALLPPTKKGYEEHSLEVSNNKTSEQSFSKPVMLTEFFPQEFFNEDQVTAGVHMVSFEELSEDEMPRVSVFDRLGRPQTRKCVFNRLSAQSSRQKGVIQAGGSVFDRLASSNVSTAKALLEDEWKDDKETCSRIPSRMKRHLLLEIDTNGSLKVKRHVVVRTSSVVQRNSGGNVSEHVSS